MKLYYEWGTNQIRKHGEELCGDSIVVKRQTDSVTLVLSDGLGSGVKANILATLTTSIAMHMLANDLPLGEVVQTLSETLPVDRVRKLAYSTFAIAKFHSSGPAWIVEFDSPSVMLLRQRKIQPLVYEERLIDSKKIHEAVIDLEIGDWIVFVSDGVLNAGIGGLYPLGWGWEQTAHFIEEHAHRELSAEELANKIAETVNELYAGAPGDDVSIIVIKVRHKLLTNVFTGPPSDRTRDFEIISNFFKRSGKLVVCGGTTAKIVSRQLGQPLEVELTTMTSEVPPIARVEGIDLVSEGILTLTRVNDLLRSGADKDTVKFQTDGASSLIRLLLDADHIHFIVGHAVNPAHQNPELPYQLGIRMLVVQEIGEELRTRGKEITIESV
ncbi:MAG TPA: PP2C family protein-serine/threonine phosphatase [Spirochaetota bacterium]|nr:PP2C family protein-serine/threonine phosphatase [Spirochaetota bacterium]